MKKFTILLLTAGLMFSMGSCEKDEVEDPTTNTPGTPTDTTGTSTVVEADVLGLAQNFVKAEGLSTDNLHSTLVSKFTGALDGFDYVDLFVQGDIGHNVRITMRGSELKEGNFQLKKWALAGGCSESEVIVQVAVKKDGDTALLDFETSDNSSLSIKKDENGFYVIKMAPLVGTNRNSWQPTITEEISFHIVSNPAKIVSDITPDPYDNIYGFKLLWNGDENQSRESLSSGEIGISFYDYDFTNAAPISSQNYVLSNTGIDGMEFNNGTVPQSVHMSYSVNWVGWPADYSQTQNIEMELTEKTIYVKYTDIDFVNPSDPNDVITASGEWEMAR